MSDPRTGMTVVHRRYVPFSHAHYAGHLVDGAYGLGLFGDVATEHPVICAVDRGMVKGMLGALVDAGDPDVRQIVTESSIARGDTCCATAV